MAGCSGVQIKSCSWRGNSGSKARRTKPKASFAKWRIKIKARVGRAANNPSLEAQGQVEKFGGKVQKKIGQVEKVLGILNGSLRQGASETARRFCAPEKLR
jgi:uncharacterized protein YjbJ (UPF0337 family)